MQLQLAVACLDIDPIVWKEIILIIFFLGKHDVSIQISDQGTGMSRDVIDHHLFQYLYSTAPRPSMNPIKAPLAGYGYGLPLSRLYARYFHGDLVLNSHEGLGTDAVVYLKALPQDAVEVLPVFKQSLTPEADWIDQAYRQSVKSHNWHKFNTHVILSEQEIREIFNDFVIYNIFLK